MLPTAQASPEGDTRSGAVTIIEFSEVDTSLDEKDMKRHHSTARSNPRAEPLAYPRALPSKTKKAVLRAIQHSRSIRVRLER